METHFSKTLFQDKVALFSVFDGHGGNDFSNLGPEISNFAKRNVYELLIRNTNFQQAKF